MSDNEVVKTETPAALFGHCQTTYNAMLVTAQVIDNGEAEIVVWEGMLTNLITVQLHLSNPYYTKIREALMRMGCMKQLRRGGGTSPSQWRLLTEPTLEAYNNTLPPKTPPIDRYSILEERINVLNNRLLEVEGLLENVILAEIKKKGL